MAQIGPQSYVAGNGSTGVPMVQPTMNPALNGPRGGIAPGGAQPVAKAPGGDFRSGAAVDAEAIDTIVKFGHSILAPMVEKQKQENFWIGVQAAAQGNAVEDMVKNQNIFDKFLGSSAMVQGARMFTVDSEMQKTYGGIIDNMDELRKMSPDEFARHTIGLAQQHMTHDSETNSMIQAGMMKQLPQLFQLQGKAHFDWAQDELLKAGYNNGVATSENFQAWNKQAQTALANGTMSPEEYKTAAAGAMQQVFSPMAGETSETHAKRVASVLQSQINSGNLALYNAANREGAFNDMDPNIRIQLENMAQGQGLRRAKERFANDNPQLFAQANAALANAGSLQEAAGVLKAINGQFQIANGAFGDDRYQIIDESDTLKNGAIAFARAEAKNAADQSSYNIQQVGDSKMFAFRADVLSGKYQTPAEQEQARANLVNDLHGMGVKELHGLDNPITSINEWVSQQEKAFNAGAAARAKAEKEAEVSNLIHEGMVSLSSGLGFPQKDGLKGPEEQKTWNDYVQTEVAKDPVNGRANAMITAARGTQMPYINQAEKSKLNAPLEGGVVPKLSDFQQSLDMYTRLKSNQDGGAAVRGYYGDNAAKLDTAADRIAADPRWQEHFSDIWNEAFNDGGLRGRMASGVTKQDREAAASVLSGNQPGILFGEGYAGSVRINGGVAFDENGYSGNVIQQSLGTEIAALRRINPTAPEDVILKNASDAMRVKVDPLNGLAIDRRLTPNAPSISSVVTQDPTLRYNPAIATKAFQSLITDWAKNQEGGSKGDPNDYAHIQIVPGRDAATGKFGYHVTFPTFESGGLWGSDKNLTGGHMWVSEDNYREAYRNVQNHDRTVGERMRPMIENQQINIMPQPKL